MVEVAKDCPSWPENAGDVAREGCVHWKGEQSVLLHKSVHVTKRRVNSHI